MDRVVDDAGICIYLLSGLLRCWCGAAVYADAYNDRRRYRCSTRKHGSVSADEVEELVWSHIAGHLREPEQFKHQVRMALEGDGVRLAATEDLIRLARERDRVTAQLRRAVKVGLLVSEGPGADELEEQVARLNEQYRKLTDEMAEAGRRLKTAGPQWEQVESYLDYVLQELNEGGPRGELAELLADALLQQGADAPRVIRNYIDWTLVGDEEKDLTRLENDLGETLCQWRRDVLEKLGVRIILGPEPLPAGLQMEYEFRPQTSWRWSRPAGSRWRPVPRPGPPGPPRRPPPPRARRPSPAPKGAEGRAPGPGR